MLGVVAPHGPIRSACRIRWRSLQYLGIQEKAEKQDEDAACESLIPVMGQLVARPEALQVVEDGFYTPPSVWDDGKARDAHKSSVGLYVQFGTVLLLFILVCVFVRLKDRQHQ